MGTVVAIGEQRWVLGFRLAGVRVIPAANAPEVMAAWSGLPPDVELVILTSAAAAAVAEQRKAGWPLVAVMDG